MALGTCQDCREGMSDSADSCPHCGSTRRPVKFVKRKKTVAVNCIHCGGEGFWYTVGWESNRLSEGGLCWMGWRNGGSRHAKREDIEKVKKEILNMDINMGKGDTKIRIIGITEIPCGCRGIKETEVEFSEEVEFD